MLKDYFEVPNKPAIKSGNVLSCDFTDHETFIPQPLDFTRNTLATYVDCNGLIKASGVSDTELVTNGDFLQSGEVTSTSWTLGWQSADTGASISNNNLILARTTSTLRAYATNGVNSFIALTNGSTYQLTYTITSNDNNADLDYHNGGSYVTAPNDVGTHTLYYTTTGTIFLFRINTNNSTIKISDVSIKEIDLNFPRIDYFTEIGKAKELQKPSLLLEPQSTNIVEYSEDIDQWTKQINGTGVLPVVTNNYTISPDGTKNASRVQLDIGNGTTSTDYSQVAVSLGSLVGDFTNSVYIKSNNSNDYNVVLTKPSGSFENKIVTSEWQRFTATSLSATNVSIRVRLRGDEGTSKNADISVWGAQTEQLAYPTSYIPTHGSTVTRNVELCDNAGQRGVFNEEGTMYVEFTELGFANPNQTSIGVSQESSSNNRLLLFRGGGSNWSFQVRAASVNVVSNSINLTTTETLNKFAKVAIRYKSGEITAFVNGSQSFTNSSTFTFNGKLDKFGFIPYDGSTGNNFYGRVKDVKVFRRTLTDSEMAELTNNIT